MLKLNDKYYIKVIKEDEKYKYALLRKDGQVFETLREELWLQNVLEWVDKQITNESLAEEPDGTDFIEAVARASKKASFADKYYRTVYLK